jgi:2-(1,2-epoxy-1,2-dihydrophenyl)acetyl-CoA isomerase
LVRAIVSAPKPVLAAVNGVAAGAGASVALACDHRVAADNAKLILAFIKVGLVPDSGAIWFLTRMLGRVRTYQLAATGDPVDAATAKEWGLFDEVVPADRFESTWRATAERLAAGPTHAYALTKELLLSAGELSLDEQLSREVAAQTEAGRSADHMEGIKAFFEKRPPKFEGR